MTDRQITILGHTAGILAALIRSARLDMSDEKRAQADFERLLIAKQLAHSREHRLSDRDIVDFWFDGFALELKLRARKKAIFRQLERYAKHESVKALMLASNTSMGLPEDINGKPLYFVRLGQGWL
jgi:hypothetical protein